MNITHIRHSGFMVETPLRRLLFDYIGGALPPGDAPLIALASHAHSDHYSPAIHALTANVVLGKGIRAEGRSLAPGEETAFDGVRVRAFESTDEGVSFLVNAGGAAIFHAGDLNLWHWRAESTKAEIAAAEAAFARALDGVPKEPIDLAFFPVDPRLGEGFAEGAEEFLRRFRPALLIPMHYWNEPEKARAFADSHPGAAFLPEGETIQF